MMMTKQRFLIVVAAVLGAGVLVVGGAQSEDSTSEFSRTVIDLGVVVSDVEKAAHFYGEVLGFMEVGGFSVSGEMAAACGLTDHRPFKVRVFAAGKEPNATKLKIMEIPGSDSAKVNNTYIGSSLGFSYLTVFVSDLSTTLDRCKAHQVTPVKKPYQLGGNNCLVVVKDPDGNNVELIGPMN
jgi:catechol 2,3-dioxygenase-like lactoylglutathione lyase family enzyme